MQRQMAVSIGNFVILSEHDSGSGLAGINGDSLSVPQTAVRLFTGLLQVRQNGRIAPTPWRYQLESYFS